MQAVQEPVNDPGDHEGRPYISAASSEACRGDPRCRPDHSQVLQAVQDPVADSFHSIMHSEVNVADNDPIIIYALSHPGAVEVDRLQLDSPVLHNLKTNGVAAIRLSETVKTGERQQRDIRPDDN